jgi:hypothetical protein
MDLTLNVKIPVEDFAEAAFELTQDELHDLIMELDRSAADYEFTIKLVRALVESLKKDVESGAEPFTAAEIGL